MTSVIARLSWTPRGRHLFVFDVVAVAMAIVAAFALRFDANDVAAHLRTYSPAALVPLLVMPPVFIAFGLYRREWRFASVRELVAISGAILVGTGIVFIAIIILAELNAAGADGFPRSVPVVEGLLLAAVVGGSRFTIRAGSERWSRRGEDRTNEPVRALVYGAGEVGAAVTRVVDRDSGSGLRIVGFIDDDPGKTGRLVLGRRVQGPLATLPEAVRRTGAEELVVAIADAPGTTVRAAFEAARSLGLEVRTVPRPRDLLSTGTGLGGLRKVSVEDLLRRRPVDIDLDAVAGYINGASVLVTGGGGSIGGELARQIIGLGPRLLTVVDNHEEALWSMEAELADGKVSGQVAFRLVDVRSAAAMDKVIREAEPDVVFHAAALKHVPIVEAEPSEGAMTNVLGTRNTLRACEAAGVPRFVLISTDKAVEPVGAMGLTKRAAELLTVATAIRTGSPYVAVRFGNVLGSSGSVIPMFQRQLAERKPITITHPDVTRFFMTIPEAVSLILEAAAHPQPGDIYVLDMGEPIRIVDLARDLVSLSGLDPDDVPFVYTGLRPGERLHEVLLHDDERVEATGHAGIMRARTGAQPDPANLEAFVDQLVAAATVRDDRSVRELLRQVPRISGGVPAPGPARTQPEGAVR